MADKEINITYETLFDLLRRERGKEDLQELEKGFYDDVLNYLKEKYSIIGDSNISSPEKEKIENQLGNTKRILIELYDRREKKLLNSAMHKTRVDSANIDVSNMLDYELEIFNVFSKILADNRKNVLVNLLNLKNLNLPIKTNVLSVDSSSDSSSKGPVNNCNEEKSVIIRFIHPVPKFLGRELEVYGPFDKGVEISLPSEIANILINKGRAEKI